MVLAHMKVAAERVLVAGGAARLARRIRRRRDVILAYHNIVPDDSTPFGDRSLHLPLSRFVRQLDLLLAEYDVVSLDDLFRRASDRPRAAITFDDAYQGAVTLAIPELAARRMPATIFVAPGFIPGFSFWWDTVGSDGGLDTVVRERALHELAGDDVRVRSLFPPRRAAPPLWCAASEEQLATALQVHEHLTLGSHTVTHRNLTRLEDNELRDELEHSKRWVWSNYTQACEWLSYPYGIADARVQRAAARAGYRGALMVSGGHVATESVDMMAVPRANIAAGLSLEGFDLLTAGITGS